MRTITKCATVNINPCFVIRVEIYDCSVNIFWDNFILLSIQATVLFIYFFFTFAMQESLSYYEK